MSTIEIPDMEPFRFSGVSIDGARVYDPSKDWLAVDPAGDAFFIPGLSAMVSAADLQQSTVELLQDRHQRLQNRAPFVAVSVQNQRARHRLISRVATVAASTLLIGLLLTRLGAARSFRRLASNSLRSVASTSNDREGRGRVNASPFPR